MKSPGLYRGSPKEGLGSHYEGPRAYKKTTLNLSLNSLSNPGARPHSVQSRVAPGEAPFHATSKDLGRWVLVKPEALRHLRILWSYFIIPELQKYVKS